MRDEKLQIKLFEKSDISLMREIIEDDEDTRKFMPERLAAWLDDPKNIAFIAVSDGKAVALIEGYSLECLDDRLPRYFIYSVDVLPAYRGQGVGKSLLAFVLEYTSGGRFSESFVISDRGNIPACRLYEGLGGKNDYEDEVVFVWNY